MVKATAGTALPAGSRCEAKAFGEIQGPPRRPSTKHRGAMLRAHMTLDVDQNDHKDEEEEEDIQIDIYEEEDSRRDS